MRTKTILVYSLMVFVALIATTTAQVSVSGGQTTWSYTLPNADALEYAEAFVWKYGGQWDAFSCDGQGACNTSDMKKGEFVDYMIKDHAKRVHYQHQRYLYEGGFVETPPPALG